MLRGEYDAMYEITYRLVSANFRMILDITLNILSPDDRVISVRSEELHNVSGPRFDGIEPFLAKYIRCVALDGNDGGRGEMVTEDSK